MKQSFWNKRIPTLLGIFLIIFGVGITTFLVRRGSIFTSRAGPTDVPKNVTISNVSDISFTLSYITDTNVLGSIAYGKNKNVGQVALDDRDQNGSLSPHTVHIFTIKKLDPSTTYYFSVQSGQNTYLKNGGLYTVTTAQTLDTISPNKPLSGKVTLPDGTAVKEVLIYADIKGAQLLVAIPGSDGSYTLPLDTLRSVDLGSYFTISDDTEMTMHMVNGTFISQVEVLPNTKTPIPIVVLSKDYDFRQNLEASTSALTNAQPIFSFGNTKPSRAFQILAPQKNQGLTDNQPVFKGTALPGSQVKIIIHSDLIQTQVTADAFGNWSFRPTTPLPPGQHTITMLTRDVSGIMKEITQTFTVFASGSQISQSATPSATITFTPTPLPLVTLTSSPTLAPTVAPTAIITQPPTPQPTQIIVTPFPTKTPLPVTGSTSVMIAGIVGLTITCIGILLLLLSFGGAV